MSSHESVDARFDIGALAGEVLGLRRECEWTSSGLRLVLFQMIRYSGTP
jgi:hypothetical protein